MEHANAINWFELPVTDIKRAKGFYENIFGFNMGETSEMMGMKMVFFPFGEKNVSGALVEGPMHKPSQEGALVYLNANIAGMENILNKIPEAGGKVVMPKTQISPEIGYMAFFIDS